MLNNFSTEWMGMIAAAVPTHTTLHISTTLFSNMLITVFKWNVDNKNEDTTADQISAQLWAVKVGVKSGSLYCKNWKYLK